MKEIEQKKNFVQFERDYDNIIKEINDFENNINQYENVSLLDRWRFILDDLKNYMEQYELINIED